MARVKRAVNAHKKRRTTLELASGYRGQRSRLYRKAKEQVLHSLNYAYRDRRARKGDFRKLWITRINAAARANGMTYNRFVQGLKAAGVEVDRKVLADIAVTDEAAFAALVEVAKANLPAPRNRREGIGSLTTQVEPPRTERSARVVAARKLLRRAGRDRAGRFLVEGAQAVREAQRHGRVREVFVTDAAAARHPDLLGAGARVDHRAGRGEPLRHRHAAGHLRRLRPARRAARRGRSRVRRSSSPCASRWPIPATRARSCGWPTRRGPTPSCSRATRSTRTTARRCGRPPARCSTSPSRASATPPPRSTPAARPGSPRSSPTRTASSTCTTRRSHRCSPGPSPGYSVARRTAFRRPLPERADHRVRVPIHGRAESLNLATAAAVCLYASVGARRLRSAPDE